MSDEDICSGCGRDVNKFHFCNVCKREMLCGKVSEPCPVFGCAEKVMKEEFSMLPPVGALYSDPRKL